MSKSTEYDVPAPANGGRRPRWKWIAAAALGVTYLAILPILVFLYRDDARLRQEFIDYVSLDDRWVIYRTKTEYQSLVSSLRPPDGTPATLKDVRTKLDILYSRNETLKATYPRLGEVAISSNFDTFTRTLDSVIADADLVLAGEPGPTISPYGILALSRILLPLDAAIVDFVQHTLSVSAAERTALHVAGQLSERRVRITVAGFTALTVITAIGLSWIVIRQRRTTLRLRELNRSLRKARAELTDAVEAAETASLAKSDFLANMSHELRTPLNAIIGFSEIMEQGFFGPIGNPRYQDYANEIRRSGRHLLSIINDILDISRIESGHMQLVEIRCDLPTLIRAALTLIQKQADDKQLNLTWSVDATLPALYADSRALIQVLVNFLHNAVKFTHPGGTVKLSAIRTENGDFEIAVSDSGIGMRPEDIALALEPFGQIRDSVYLVQEASTGLGLPIAKALVELHGGSLGIASTPGEGTTITVRLPATRALE